MTVYPTRRHGIKKTIEKQSTRTANIIRWLLDGGGSSRKQQGKGGGGGSR
jgi:hypothetical protein